MKIGQDVNYYRPAEAIKTTAEIIEIVGTGQSRAKVLTLRYKEDDKVYQVTDVFHYDDGVEGEPFWLPKHSRAPKGWDAEELTEDIELPEPIVLSQPETPPKKAAKKTTKKKKGR